MPDDVASLEQQENEYSIDGTYYGNMTRLVNHSCTPNVIAVTVYTNTHEFPNISFFAKDNINSGDELTIDYKTHDAMVCHCGSTGCRYNKKKK
jgi:SET domain-containing protein